MAKFLLSYHGGGMAATEEERAKAMEAWGAWMAGLGDALVDGGNPTGQVKTISADGSTVEGGGANPVTGYSLITADSLDRAITLAEGCPILNSGGSIEVAEALEIM